MWLIYPRHCISAFYQNRSSIVEVMIKIFWRVFVITIFTPEFSLSVDVIVDVNTSAAVIPTTLANTEHNAYV